MKALDTHNARILIVEDDNDYLKQSYGSRTQAESGRTPSAAVSSGYPQN